MIYIAIYLIGGIVAYLIFRSLIKKETKSWTEVDRNLTLIISIFSWVSVLASLVIMGLEGMFNGNDKPASW